MPELGRSWTSPLIMLKGYSPVTYPLKKWRPKVTPRAFDSMAQLEGVRRFVLLVLLVPTIFCPDAAGQGGKERVQGVL